MLMEYDPKMISQNVHTNVAISQLYLVSVHWETRHIYGYFHVTCAAKTFD